MQRWAKKKARAVKAGRAPGQIRRRKKLRAGKKMTTPTVAPETLERAYAYIQQRGQVTAREIAEQLEVSQSHGRNIAKALLKKNLVGKLGSMPEYFHPKERENNHDFKSIMLVWEALEDQQLGAGERVACALEILRIRYDE